MSAGGERPSYDELAALVASQAEEIAALRAEVAELKRRLGQKAELLEAAVVGLAVHQADPEIAAPPQRAQARWAARESRFDVGPSR